MQLKDSQSRYGWVSIFLHWFVAVLVITMLVIGNKAGQFLPFTEERTKLLFLHASIGWILLIPFLVRLTWRISQGRPERPQQHPTLKLLGDWVPRFMLVLIIIQLFAGIMLVFTVEYGVEIFGVHILPSPLSEDLELRSLFSDIHIKTAYTLLTVIVLHVGGALKHLIVDRDNVLHSMLWPQDR